MDTLFRLYQRWLLMLLSLGAAVSLSAQHYGFPWAGDFSVAFMQYKPVKQASAGYYRGLQLGAYRYMNATWNTGVIGIIAPSQSVVIADDSVLRGSAWDVQAVMQYKFNNGVVLKESRMIAPFFTTGIGYNNSFQSRAVYIPLQGGIHAYISKDVKLQAQAGYKLAMFGTLASPMVFSVGFVYAIPTGAERQKPNQKQDRIEDNDDTRIIAQPQPPTATPQPVIPAIEDADQDGIADMYDDCPTQKGDKKHHGCPQLQTIDPVKSVPAVVAPAKTTIEIIDHKTDVARLSVKPVTGHGVVIEPADMEILRKAVSFVRFEPISANILESSHESLNEIAMLLDKYPEYNLQVIAHTDNTGSAEASLALSVRRSVAVRSYLVSQGARMARISINGKGAAEPVASNTDEVGRSLNQRVEFMLFNP